jgi:hypothetical protein
VTSGPNATSDLDGNVSTPAGFIGTCTTAGSGTCTKSYTDMAAGSAGHTDTLTAFNDANANQNFDGGEINGTASQNWSLATGTFCVDLDPNASLDPVHSSQSFTATVTDGTLGTDTNGTNNCSGNPVSGVSLVFSKTDAGGATTALSNTGAQLTNANGQVTDTLTETNSSNGSTQVSVAGSLGTTYTLTGNPGPNTVTWATPGQATSISCTPSDQLHATGGTATFSCSVTDAFGNGVPNATNIDGRVTAGPNAGNDLDGDPASALGTFADDRTADGTGHLTLSYTDLAHTTADDTVVIFKDSSGLADTEDATQTPNSGNLTARWNANLSTAKIAIDMQPTGTDTTPPTANATACDASFASFGGATWETSGTSRAGKVHAVCVGVADAANSPLQGASVTLASTGVGQLTDATGANAASTKTAVTDATGTARFYVYSTLVGAQHLTATASEIPGSATGTQNWIPAGTSNLTVSPTSATINAGQTQTVIFHATDAFGNDEVGQAVSVVLTPTPAGAAEFADGTCCTKTVTTGGNGQASVDVKGISAGLASVAGTATGNDVNGTAPTCGTTCTATSNLTITIASGPASTSITGLNASPRPVHRGQLLTVSGDLTSPSAACESGQIIDITVGLRHGRVLHGTATTDSGGAFSASFRMPRSTRFRGGVHIAAQFAGTSTCGASSATTTDGLK